MIEAIALIDILVPSIVFLLNSKKLNPMKEMNDIDRKINPSINIPKIVGEFPKKLLEVIMKDEKNRISNRDII